MKTWSLERILTDAIHDAKAVAKYLASLALAPVLDAVYPPLGSGIDVRDGAEELAEREAEEEVGEGIDRAPLGSCVDCFKPVWWDAEWEKWYHVYDNSPACAYADDDVRRIAITPGQHNPTDRLCVYTSANGIDTEAICGVCRPVRDIVEQMIEERFPDSAASETAADSGQAVSDATPPSAPSPSHSPAWSDLADAMVEHRPPSPQSRFIAGYRAAIELVEAKAEGDRKLAPMLPDSHIEECADWGMELARYMRAIEPKNGSK